MPLLVAISVGVIIYQVIKWWIIKAQMNDWDKKHGNKF